MRGSKYRAYPPNMENLGSAKREVSISTPDNRLYSVFDGNRHISGTMKDQGRE